VPEIRDFLKLIITGWGESGKVVSQVSIAVFSDAVEKYFGQRWLSPLEKIGPYAYGINFRLVIGLNAVILYPI